MKKRLAILLMLTALLLPGCGGQKGTRAAICLRRCDNSAAAENLEAMRTALTDAGYEVAAADAEADQSRQTRQIRELLEEGYDLLVVEPVLLDTAAEIAEMARQEKVPVIFIGYEPPLDNWEGVCYVGSLQQQAGAAQAQVLQRVPGCDLNGDGTVAYAIIAGPEDDMDALAITQGCTQGITGGQCLEVCYTDWSRASAETACAQLLSAWGKDLEAVLCNSDELAMGAMAAITEGGRTVNETICLVGLGGDFQSRLLLRSGDLTGTVYLPPREQAQMIVDAAAQLLSGQTPEAKQYGSSIPLTKENVEEYIAE